MIKSMTGFGRADGTYNNLNVSVEVKSVNHRYFEFNCRLPKIFNFLEEKIKKTFQERVYRGKLDVYISILSGSDSNLKITLNHDYIDQYVTALKQLKSTYGLAGDISISDVASKSDIFITESKELNEEEITEFLIDLINKAIDVFILMRKEEGAVLKNDILIKLDYILDIVGNIEGLSLKTKDLYQERLKNKLEETLQNYNLNNYDEQRILTEVAIFADKIAVDEETVRLKSHIAQMKEILNSDDAVGRKLDFLVQEMNREANTIGSKAQDSDVAKLVIEIKTTIEKIREQVQNIE